MVRTQIQFPDPLYRRLKAIAEQNDWPLAEVVRRATELYANRFSDTQAPNSNWTFPTLDAPDDYLIDPSSVEAESEAIELRSR
ncbi:MAG: hypothetical protein HOI95_20535 [Chromatiales bacterium]|jgi:hypothetical protein|nr:hypothetical protein [Chromatiales bacterium]